MFENMVAVGDNNNEDKIIISISLLAGVSLLIFLHLMCLYVGALAIITALLENAIVYYFLVSKKYKQALLYMCLFYTTSYSNTVFFGTSRGLETIYSIENIPLFHGYLMLLSFFFLFIIVCFPKKEQIRKNSNSLSIFAAYTILSGLVMGFLSILVNGFQYRAIISDINQCVVPTLMILICLNAFNEDHFFSKKYFSLVIHIFISYIIIAWITTSLGIYADFVQTRDKVLMLPLPSFYMSCIILFIGLMKTYKDKAIIIVAFMSTIYFQLSFDSCMNGKSWMVFTASVLVGLYYLFKNIKHNFILYGTVIGAFAVFAIKLVPIVNSFISETENLKLLEFVSIFEAADSGNLDDMDQSSRFRFVELINVSEQYVEQPIFALPGRGYGGSIHSNGYFWDRSESGFTMDQYDSDKFYRLHESMNVIYLKFGIIGLLFFVLILFKLVKGIKYSPLCFVGFIWLLFFWGYENSLLFIGLPALVFGFLCVNNKFPSTNYDGVDTTTK